MSGTTDEAIAVDSHGGTDSDSVPLVDEHATTPIYALGTESVVEIAAEDFRDDIERVTGQCPTLEFKSDGGDAIGETGDRAVLVSPYGVHDAVDTTIDALFDDHDLETATESYALAAVADPEALEVDAALLIVGSDPRGTAYGVYELSRRIGVSPWYWWADVPTDERDELHLSAGAELEGPPSVSYRGIFINDEDFGFRPWATQTHEPEVPEGIGPKTYERVFELLLRLKANTIWPAMHGGGKAFYQIDGNREAADRYGIVVGTSHCEPMHRNNVEEWDSDERGEWNYATNGETIREYWADRVAAVAEAENVFTVGMRGIHDSGMPGGETVEETTALLQTVLEDQRDMLAEHVDPDVASIPQIFCPYKEVLECYEAGLEVPEDVCLVWPNDNFGFVRRLPTAPERRRSGGHGIYYHLSYWGRPHDHQWLCSTPPALIREELCKAYEHGAREMWIANVGDIKPAETETEYFFELAWDVESVREESVEDWLERWASREFDAEYTEEIAEIYREYHRLARARKPEHVGWNSVYPNTEQNEPAFSATACGDEARRRLEAYERIDASAAAIHDALPEDQRTAFFHLVQYPIRCAMLINRKVVDAMRSRLYAGQGRASADEYADRALEAVDEIESATERYNGSSGGKWKEMMSERPRDLPVFDRPTVGRVESEQGPTLGVAVEGEPRVAGAGRATERPELEFPEFVEGVDHPRFVDIYNRGNGTIEWTAETSHDWLEVSRMEGAIDLEERLHVSIDWASAPETETETVGSLSITGAGREVSVDVPIRPRSGGVQPATGSDSSSPSGPGSDADHNPLFVESAGAVAIEAEHATDVVAGADTDWESIDGLSRTTGTVMGSRPVTGPRLEPDATVLEDRAPRLEYEFEVHTTGAVTVEAQLLPTHAPEHSLGLRYAVAIDGGDPTVVDFDANGGEHDPEWQENVLRGSAIETTTHEVDRPGRHTLSVYAVDPGVVLDRLVIRTDGDGDENGAGRRSTRQSYLGPRETMDRRLE
ncbi:glycosyl hydrolase 115 family protein [Halobacteria archaeon AArc-m2/3/4]|uniref:Glycosyl hydrolase 115 family protein n=1 Tax=Natronoglomus mannanivorans TaxID=2979990 RepID=A0ABT2QK26_9EURY|nr:glycosyl hydrolase 115 family protein [Halobacteria archaeon AArc-m2/3/4]